MLEPGSPAPAVVLTNQHGATVDLVALRGRRVLVFFYPKANTPGCTQQACGLRDVAAALDGTVIVGISPDKPAAQQRFDDKFSLGYDLLADTDHAVAEAFGVWQEKALYLSLIHISEPTRLLSISYAVFCLKKKKLYPTLTTNMSHNTTPNITELTYTIHYPILRRYSL
mgnify:CR=1 FL=1